MSKPKLPTPTSPRDYLQQIGDRFVNQKLVPRLHQAMDTHGIGRDHPLLAVFVTLIETDDAIAELSKVVREHAERLARDSAATRLATSTVLERVQPLLTFKADLDRLETLVRKLEELQAELPRINARLAAIEARQAPSSIPWWREFIIFATFAWAVFEVAKFIGDFFQG